MTFPPAPKRPFGLGAYFLVVIAITVVSGLAAGAAALVGDQPGSFGLVLTAAFMTVAMAAAFGACVWWWRGIDEAAREAHKWAWWWGGSGGMALGAVMLLTLGIRSNDTGLEMVNSSAADLVAAGVIAILMFQLAGYGVAWAAWWLKHR